MENAHLVNIKNACQLLRSMKRLLPGDTVYKGTLANRLITGIGISDSDSIVDETLDMACSIADKAVEMFYVTDEPRFTPEDVTDALCDQEQYRMRLGEFATMDMEAFAREATAACEEYRIHNDIGYGGCGHKGSTRVVHTPIGDIIAYPKHEHDCAEDYPGIYIDLVTPSGEQVMMACVEYDTTEENFLGTLYADMLDDSPTDIKHYENREELIASAEKN